MTGTEPSTETAPRLTRDRLEAAGRAHAAPPVRIVHLGLGAFHRAHQVWYTAEAADADEWGIAAFTGRSPHMAEQLQPQGGAYTLIERGPDGDRATILTNLVEAVDGADVGRLVELVAAPQTAIVTLTITEAGYRLTPDAVPNPEDPVVARDLEILRARVHAGVGADVDAGDEADAGDDAGAGAGRGAGTGAGTGAHAGPDAAAGAAARGDREAEPTSVLARLLLGLAARRNAGAGPIAVVSCDNFPDNGGMLRTGMTALAERMDDALGRWVAENVSFVGTSVDRITPATTEADLALVTALTGFDDAAPVITEPFRDWILSGAFPAGRPRWETAGARFVDDIEPFERRKLWLLNGAHSYLAYAGPERGHDTVAAAIADPALRRGVEQLWDEAAAHLPADLLDLDAYRGALLDRFANARIEHRLAQIAAEGATKLRIRIAPVALAERAVGREAAGCAAAVAAWIRATHRAVGVDAQAEALRAIVDNGGEDEIRRLIAVVEPRLAADHGFVALVADLVAAAA